MAARSIWKGVIRLEAFRLPVRLFSAVEDRTVHFHLLHDADQTRVQQRLVDPATGQVFGYHDAQRGYEVELGVFVILRQDDLLQAEPEASRDIEVICLLQKEVISHPWYDRPYYLGPDGNPTRYYALVRALQKERLAAVVRWTFRRTEYVGAISVRNDALSLITLRRAGEVIQAAELEPPTGRAFLRKEREMAEQLLHALDDDFRPEDFHDEYRQRVLDLIKAKQSGEAIVVEEAEPEPPEGESLLQILEASLTTAK